MTLVSAQVPESVLFVVQVLNVCIMTWLEALGSMLCFHFGLVAFVARLHASCRCGCCHVPASDPRTTCSWCFLFQNFPRFPDNCCLVCRAEGKAEGVQRATFLVLSCRVARIETGGSMRSWATPQVGREPVVPAASSVSLAVRPILHGPLRTTR